MDAGTVVTVAGSIAGGGGILAGVGWAARGGWRMVCGVQRFLSDWQGEPARAGVDARPGVMVRLERLETSVGEIREQMHPNGGGSLRDAVNRVEEHVSR